jgi:hypothetical protein
MIQEEGTFQFLGVFDALAIIIWLFILLGLVSSNFNKNKDKSYYKYYKIGFYSKLFAAIAFSIIYIYKYGGGDTAAYWDTAQKFNNLFYFDIGKFIVEFFHPEPFANRYLSFDMHTGVPPEWIYNEKEGLFTSKIYTLLTFLTFRSYFAMTFICAYFSFKASWKLLEMGIKYNATSERNLAIGTLFLPSTAFWCTGISKDTIVYCCVIYALDLLFFLFDKSVKKGFIFYFKLLIIYFLLVNIRDFMLLTAIAPFIFALGIKYSNRAGNSNFTKFAIQALLIILILIGMAIFFSSSKATEITQEAQIIQSDLKNNSEYGGAKYDLGVTDFTPIGMLKAMPISIFTAFYRPFVWEAGSLFILISALETLVLLALTINLIIKNDVFKFTKKIRENEFLVMATVFSLILGFFAGYTSGLFGVLVRFKAPLLPFLFILLTMNLKPEKIKN